MIANANAEQERKINEAEVNYQRKIEDIHNKGLQKTFNDLDFTSTKHKVSLNYLKTLRDHEMVKYLNNQGHFSQTILRKLNSDFVTFDYKYLVNLCTKDDF